MLSNGGSINKKPNKDSIKSKLTFTQSKLQMLNKQTEIKKTEIKNDEIQIKDRSPLMYNRNKINLNPGLSKKKPESDINILTKVLEKPIELQSQINQKNTESNLIEIEIKNEKLENEVKILKKVILFFNLETCGARKSNKREKQQNNRS